MYILEAFVLNIIAKPLFFHSFAALIKHPQLEYELAGEESDLTVSNFVRST